MDKSRERRESLVYHAKPKPGKTEVVPTKKYNTQRDLAIAYSPGVAIPCQEIEDNKVNTYKYTNKGNLVAVISNGTAVLGLGDIGPEASKPVMEGKALLFKIFADIDVFDIEINEKDPKKFVEIVKSLSPTFGGINLEDIKAPEAFEIERELIKALDIPVMHDDQHGTAMISCAALINAIDLVKKKIKTVKLVMSGAGSSAIACAKLYISFGLKKDNIIMVDSKGVINDKRTDINDEKKFFITKRNVNTLEEAMIDSDVFIGLSTGDIVTTKMLKKMAKDPIVFAMSNPNPEINYDLAMSTRKDLIMATGRSDFPNQVNNVLGFPFIFRGALDVRATKINEEMKKAAVIALANLAKKPVPEQVNIAYGETKRLAELELLDLSKQTNMNILIVRPSLVYGPEIKGNLLSMKRAIKAGWFPPLPQIKNARSMVHVDDLVSAIILVKEKGVNGEIYNVTDGKDYSTTEIYETLYKLNKKDLPKLRLPLILLNLFSFIPGRINKMVSKLVGDERYSSSKIEALGFRAKLRFGNLNETLF